jgi:hypothetical protein
MDAEIADAHSVFGRRCSVGVVEDSRQNFTNPFTDAANNQYDVWVIRRIPIDGSTAPIPPAIVGLTGRFPPPLSDVNVYVVRATYGIDPSGLESELGGIAPTPGNWLVLSGRQAGSASRVLAHEVGHTTGLGHDPNTNNLMFSSIPNGDVLSAGQCSTVLNSPNSR